jgi:hypothetical protein
MRCEPVVRIAPDAVVQHDDVQDVEKLALVLVDALDLAVEDRIGIDDLSGRRLEPLGKRNLGLALRVAELLAKTRVTGQRYQLAELRLS